EAPERGDRAHRPDASADDAEPDDHRQAPAAHVGEEPGRHLAEKHAELQPGAGQRQLERAQAPVLDGVERRDRAGHRLHHPGGGARPDVEPVRRGRAQYGSRTKMNVVPWTIGALAPTKETWTSRTWRSPARPDACRAPSMMCQRPWMRPVPRLPPKVFRGSSPSSSMRPSWMKSSASPSRQKPSDSKPYI